MPTLDWIGKDAVVKHHKDVPYRLLEPVPELSCGDPRNADGRFYPDFLCQLKDGRILAVEYKGANQWVSAEDDRLIGGLWAAMSGGRCRFVMVTDRNWASIEACL